MIENITLHNIQLFSGYSYIGKCDELKWRLLRHDLGEFVFLNFECAYDYEELMLRTDLVIKAEEDMEYVLQNFVFTDVSQLGRMFGSAKALTRLESGFPESKIFAMDEQVVLTKETQVKAFRAVSDIIFQVKNDAVIDSEQTIEVTKTLVDEVLRAPDALMNLMDIKSFDDYTFTHNVNVSTIALLIGLDMGLEKEELEELATGCLLHDVGKIKLSLELLNKEESLTDEDIYELRTHPRQGYDILIKSRGLTEKMRLVALQHHEKFQGNGYPGKLKGEEISLFARICAVADSYDALTTKRPYRMAMSPYDAIKIMNAAVDIHYDPQILKAFVKKFSLYPSGSFVRLNDQSIALVLRNNPNSVIRPVVRLIRKPNGEPYTQREEINLNETKGLYIINQATYVEVKKAD
jgi:HD-GYP domain-containing protein (c-di-GMP phosphodiesterase class II)